MKKRLFIFLVLIFAANALFAQRVVLKVATMAPPHSPWDIQMKKLAQKWNKITNGQVSLKFLDITNMGGEKSAVQKMRPSRPGQKPFLDGAVFSPVGLNELAPSARIFTLQAPFLIRNQEELDLVLKEYGSVFEKEIEKTGAKLLTWSNVGWLTFYTKQSYSNLKELKKLKIACSNDTKDFSDVLKICNFNAKDIPPQKFTQEIKSSNGADGFASVHILVYAMGLYKDLPYILDARLGPVMGGFVISEESWKLVPDKYKEEMLTALESMRKDLNDDLEKMEADYVSKMKKSGVKIIPLNKKELDEWNKEFYVDMQRVAKQRPSILNMEVYQKISKLLETYRK